MSANGYSNYQENQLVTATPGKLLLMAYDGAIRFARLAGEKMAEGDLSEQSGYINKAVAVVCELITTLREDIDPTLVSRLKSLYGYVLDRLTAANLSQDRAALDQATQILCELRSAWAQADKNVQADAGGGVDGSRAWGSEAAA